MKNMKKLAGLLLAVIMVVAMSVMAFAAPTATTLTINTAEGHTYEIYQVLKGELDIASLNAGKGSLGNVEAGENLNCTVTEFDNAIHVKDDHDQPTDVYLSGTDLAAAASAKIKTPAFATVTGTGSPVATDVVTGYYVVKDIYTDDDIECAAYMVAVAGATTMDPKTSVPDIDKNITDTDANIPLETTGNSKKTDTAAIGDVIQYKTTSTVPVTTGYKYYYYVVTDEMSAGLTYNKDLVITIGEGAAAKTLTQGTGADQYAITETNQGFELVVNDMKQFTANAPIVITYSATVNDNALIGNGENVNTNTTSLKYSNNPSDTYNKDKSGDNKPRPTDVVGETPDHITKTYVTELTIVKVDQDGALLDGAEFTLTGDNLNKVRLTTATSFEEDANGVYYKLKDDKGYTKEEPIETTYKPNGDVDVQGNTDKYDSTTKKYKVVTTVSPTSEAVPSTGKVLQLINGAFTVTGLNAGEYTLTETKTPAGYNTIDPITFTISATQKTTTTATEGTDIEWASSIPTVIVVDANKAKFDTTIRNVKGNLLPSTGGIGTTIFYVLGTILVLFAGVILVTKKRMSR